MHVYRRHGKIVVELPDKFENYPYLVRLITSLFHNGANVSTKINRLLFMLYVDWHSLSWKEARSKLIPFINISNDKELVSRIEIPWELD